MNDYILFIMSGGTIDAVRYEVTPECIAPLEKSSIPDTVKQLPKGELCDFHQWLMKDSKSFSDEELLALAEMIRKDEHQYIVVTHGTDKMPENSRILLNALQGANKVVVVTGSMVPLSHGPQSDGYANLRYVLNHIKEFPLGVHVVMQEQIFSPIGLWKDFDEKRFIIRLCNNILD